MKILRNKTYNRINELLDALKHSTNFYYQLSNGLSKILEDVVNHSVVLQEELILNLKHQGWLKKKN